MRYVFVDEGSYFLVDLLFLDLILDHSNKDQFNS